MNTGSMNYEARLAQGWQVVDGPDPLYAAVEPHHMRADGGAWVYVSMYHAGTEAWYERLFAGVPGRYAGVMLVADADDLQDIDAAPDTQAWWDAVDSRLRIRTPNGREWDLPAGAVTSYSDGHCVDGDAVVYDATVVIE